MTNDNLRGLPVVQKMLALTIDWDRSSMDNREPPRDGITCGDIRQLATDYAALLAERDEMRARLQEVEPKPAKVARGDAARINALQRNLWFVEPDYANDGWRVGKASKDGRPKHYGNSLREAIDAAISAMEGRDRA